MQRHHRTRQPLPGPGAGRSRRRRRQDRHLPRRTLPADRETARQEKAIVAVGRSILVIVWHLLADPDARYHDLGADFYDTRLGPERKKRTHVRQLEALGYKVTLEPAA